MGEKKSLKKSLTDGKGNKKHWLQIIIGTIFQATSDDEI
jgi:hypothetical protein